MKKLHAALIIAPLIVVAARGAEPSAASVESNVTAAAKFAAGRLSAFAAATEPSKSPPKRIVCVYYTPSDRKPPAGHRERLTRVMSDIQKFFAEEMARHGLGPRTVQYDLDREGLIRFHYVSGKHPTDYYLGRDFRKGYEIRAEAKPTLAALGIDDERETVVYFCHLRTEQDGKTMGIGPYYGSGAREGVFRDGRCWFTDASILDPRNLADAKTMLDDEEYGKVSIGRYNSIFIGGTAHELGHGLGLPHTKERHDEAVRGTSLMGSGNRTYGEQLRGEGRGSFLVLADALRLASHPIFSGTSHDIARAPEGKIDDLKLEVRGKLLHVSGRIKTAVAPYAVIAYNDPEGNSDYNATSWIASLDDDNSFTCDVGEFAADTKAELRIIICHVNGATSVVRRNVLVDNAGTPALTSEGTP
ncbi:MAG: hypothetical protein QM775_33940 [Pirellulales bacterium]